MKKNAHNSRAINAVKKYVELESMSGIKDFSCVSGTSHDSIKNISVAHEVSRLDILKKEVSACKKCPLARTRTNVVFGSGSAHAKLMFVGEAPGMDEDLQGLPFVGRAGQLLTKIIESIKLKREDVFIANVLKCRPPENRNPLPSEIIECEPYLIRQVELIRPKIICALGKFSAQTLLRTETPITKLRGQFYDYHGILLMPTFHPAYLLRNPNDKRLVWEDMKMIRKKLDEL